MTNPGIGLAATTLEFAPTGGPAILANPAAGTRLANIRLADFRLRAQSSSSYGLVLEGISGLELLSVGITGFKSGLVCRSIWDSRVEMCRFDTCGAAGGDPSVVIESSTADGDVNSLRFTDCTWESSRGTDLLVRDAGGGRPNKLVFRGCKFEQASVRDHRIIVEDADFVLFEGCQVFTGTSLAGGAPVHGMTVRDCLDLHIRDTRFEAHSSGVTLGSWMRFYGGNNGLIVDGAFFQTASPNNPATSGGAVKWSGTNENVRIGAIAVLYAGGSSANFPLQSGSPTTTI